MPVDEYYGGHGREVMKEMIDRHGTETGERMFYATHNKMKKKHGGGKFFGKKRKKKHG